MVQRVLLVDLVPGAACDLSALLAHADFVVEVTTTADAAGWLADRRVFALALVVVRIDAEAELEEALAALPTLPRVVVLATRDEALAIRALSAGADSVLSLPVSRRELAARLQAFLASHERAGRRRQAQPAAYRVGDLLIDPETHIVRRNGAAISLTPKEFRLLLGLASRAGQVVPHEQLLVEVWGQADPARAEILRLYIGYLRQKLEDDHRHPRLLINCRGVGYKLAVSVDARDRPAGPTTPLARRQELRA